MRITLLGVLTGMAIAFLLVFVVQEVQQGSNQAKVETDEQGKITNNTNPDRTGLG